MYQLKKLGKCLVVLDELQAIAPKRGSDTTNENTFDRLLSCLLTEIDGIKYKDAAVKVNSLNEELEEEEEEEQTAFDSKHRKNNQIENGNIVFVLGITRDINEIDPALLRPGRLDCKILIDLYVQYQKYL